MKKKKKKITLPIQIVVSLVLAIIVGLFLRKNPYIAIEYIKPFGTIFLNLLKCFVCLTVFFSIIYGIASLRDTRKLWKIGLISFIYYMCTTVIAILIGLGIANLMKGFFPLLSTNNLESVLVDTDINFLDTLVRMFPSSIVNPFYEANMMQIMVLSVIIGVSLILVSDFDEMDMSVVDRANNLCMKTMQMIMKISPVGIFCIVCSEMVENGFTFVGSLTIVLLAAYLAYTVHSLLIYSILVKALGNMNPVEFFRRIMPAVIFGFSSTSSLGSIPLNMECAQKLGADKEITSFVIPFGATVNMDGTAIYQSVCAVFIAFCYGIDLTIPQMMSIVFTIVFSSIGTVGVTGAGMVIMAMVLESIGLPVESIALVAGLDIIFDMGRTATNIVGDASCAVIVSEIMRRHKARKNKRKAY